MTSVANSIKQHVNSLRALGQRIDYLHDQRCKIPNEPSYQSQDAEYLRMIDELGAEFNSLKESAHSLIRQLPDGQRYQWETTIAGF